jgi:uncharacterized protein
MKIFKLLILLILIFAISSFGQDSLKNVITTYGKVELKVPGDFATVSFKVISEGSSLREAVLLAKEKVGLITSDLFKIGLSEKNISTSRFYSGENLDGKSFFSSASDYKTVIDTYIKIDSLVLIEDILLTISDHKPNEITEILFKLKNPEKYKLQAIEKAIYKAKEKALLLANVMDAEIEKPLMINEIIDPRNINFRGGRINPYNVVYQVDGIDFGEKYIFSENIIVTAEVSLQVLIK